MKKLVLAIAAFAAMTFVNSTFAEWSVDLTAKTATDGNWLLTLNAVNNNNPPIVKIEWVGGGETDGVLDVSGLYGCALQSGKSYQGVWAENPANPGMDLVTKLIVSTQTHTYLMIKGFPNLTEVRTTDDSDPYTLSVSTFYKDDWGLSKVSGEYHIKGIVTFGSNGNTFKNCENLTSIVLEGSFKSTPETWADNSKKQLPGYMFYQCWALTNVAFITSGEFTLFPPGMFTNGQNGSHWWNPSNYARPMNVQSVTVNGIEVVRMPDLLSIQNQAFQSCTNYLQEIILPNCEFFGYRTFEDAGVTGLRIPNMTLLRPENNGNKAFEHSRAMTYIYAPKMQLFRSSEFYACHSLKWAYFPELTDMFGASAFASCLDLRDIYLPSVTNVAASSFSSCSSITNLVLGGESIVFIGQKAFENAFASDQDVRILWNAKTKPDLSAASGWLLNGHSKDIKHFVRKEADWTTLQDSSHGMYVATNPSGVLVVSSSDNANNIKNSKNLVKMMDSVVTINFYEGEDLIFKTMLPGMSGEDTGYTLRPEIPYVAPTVFATASADVPGVVANVIDGGKNLEITVPASVLPAADESETQDLTVNISVTSKGPTPTPKTGLLIIVR